MKLNSNVKEKETVYGKEGMEDIIQISSYLNSNHPSHNN